MVRLRAVTAALVAAWLLVACDDDPEPRVQDPPPSVTLPPTQSDSASTSPSVELDPEATVRSFIDEWNAALASGDTSKVHSFAAESCRGCDELARVIEDIVDAGGSFDGGEWSVATLKEVSRSERAAAIYLAVDVAPGSTVTEAGSSPTAYPATTHLLNLELVRSGSDWRFAVIELVS